MKEKRSNSSHLLARLWTTPTPGSMLSSHCWDSTVQVCDSPGRCSAMVRLEKKTFSAWFKNTPFGPSGGKHTTFKVKSNPIALFARFLSLIINENIFAKMFGRCVHSQTSSSPPSTSQILGHFSLPSFRPRDEPCYQIRRRAGHFLFCSYNQEYIGVHGSIFLVHLMAYREFKDHLQYTVGLQQTFRTSAYIYKKGKPLYLFSVSVFSAKTKATRTSSGRAALPATMAFRLNRTAVQLPAELVWCSVPWW